MTPSSSGSAALSSRLLKNPCRESDTADSMTHRIDGKERLTMRGWDNRRDGLFSYVRPERRIRSNHPLRLIRGVADEALPTLNDQFAMLYSDNGRPSIPPEQMLRALLLQAFYSVRSERQLMEQLNY